MTPTQDDRNSTQQGLNAAQQGRNAAQQGSNQDLETLIRTLTDAVVLLSTRFRRKRISDGVLASVVVAMALLLGYYFLVDLPDRRSESRENVRELACYAVQFVPEGRNPAADGLREKYDCPPFSAASLPPGTSTVAPTATVTRSATPKVRIVTRTPGAVPTATVTSTPRAAAPITRTAIVRPPAVTRTRVVRATVTVTPPICRGPLGPVLC